jgi:hypothetical protein
MLPIPSAGYIRIVSTFFTSCIALADSSSFLPESPRYLISKDRDDEAFDILVKYYAEGDRDPVLVRAEMAQIKETIKIKLEHAKLSWMDMLRTAGMRRRVFIVTFMGLFTQWSGNTLISYYLSTILGMIGYNTTYAKTRITVSHLFILFPVS